MLRCAGNIHADTNQKFDIYPYVFHLQRVLDCAMKYGEDIPDFEHNKYIIAFGACFHDTIEDARLTYNDVVKEASKFFEYYSDVLAAAEIVYALTNEKGRNRAERANEKYYTGIRNTAFGSFVKCCDRMANATYAIEHKTSMAKKYRKEMQEFLSHLSTPEPADPKYIIPKRLMDELANL